MHWDQSGEFVCGYWCLKGWNKPLKPTQQELIFIWVPSIAKNSCVFFKLATYHWGQCCGGLVSHPGRGGGVALGIVTIPAQLPPPLPGWDTSPPQHCSQWYVASLKKTHTHTKSKTCEKRGKVRNSFLTKIKVAVSHKTGKKLCC